MVNADARIDSNAPIQQALHGYAEGHTLLAASCELSVAEKKRLLLMSDLSGSSIHPAFVSYLTGYPLPGQRYYAFARTWYANEMSRPGCAWTHTLLVDMAYLGQLRRPDSLDTLFSRPHQNSYSSYSQPIIWRTTDDSADITNRSNEFSRLYEQIADNLYGKPAKKVLVSAKTPDPYESVILSIWCHQWPRLRRNFSFCSGAFNPRSIEGVPLDCQVIPTSSDSPTALKITDDMVVLGFGEITRASPWVSLMRQISTSKLLTFMYQYGSDVQGARSRFVPLLYAYQLQDKTHLQAISFDGLFGFLAKSFPSPKEAIQLKRELITRKIDKNVVNYYPFIHTWLTSTWTPAISGLDWDIAILISELWHSDLYSVQQMGQLLQKADPSRLTETDKLAVVQILPIESWLKLDWIDVPLLIELLLKNPNQKDFRIVWQASLSIQQQWIHALGVVDEVDWLAVNEGMLIAGNGKWIHTVIQHLGVKAIFASLDWSNRADNALPLDWEKIITENSTLFFDWLATQKELTPNTIELILKLYNPATLPLLSVGQVTWAKVSQVLLSNSATPNTAPAIALLFSSCLLQNAHTAIDIVVSFFEPLHERAKRNQLDDYSWSVLKSLEQNRPSTSPLEGFWNMFVIGKDNSIAEWDRCEYLRQITADYFVLYNWPVSTFSKMIPGEDVFKRIVGYCRSFQEGKKYISKLKRYLKSQNSNVAKNQLLLIRQEQQKLL